jgi:dipeptidyl aminopeptidase/acylaminoacyl peptidase
MSLSCIRASLAIVALAAIASPAAAQPAQPATGAATARPSKQYPIEQFMNVTGVRAAGFSADESRLLFSSNKTGIWNVYSIPAGGGEWVPITTSTVDSTYAVSYFPEDDRVLFTRDQGGNELNHLYVRAADGQEKDLTPGDKLKAQFAGWSGDLAAFYVATNERDARFFDVYRYDAKTYERTLFFKNDLGYLVGNVSRDGKWVALIKANTTNDSDLHLWQAATGEARHISPHKGEASYTPAAFDPASTWFYYLTNDGSEFTRVRRYSLAAGTHEDVEKADWDIVSFGFSWRGTYRLTGLNEDGRYSLRVVETASGKPVALPRIPDGSVAGGIVSRGEKRLAFTLNGDRSPNDLYTLAFGQGAPVRLTTSLPAGLDAADLVDTQVVRFKSFDGMTIPNILYKPHQATASAKAPAPVWVHGGPGGQTTRGYSAVIQYLANHGYVVLGINNRGSSGYGKSFLAADDQKHGREPLWDCVEAKKYLASLPYVDANRVGIIGGSYGGYMVLAALAYKPEVFDVGVDVFGVSNWVRTLENIPAWWEAQRKALYAELGDPAVQKEMLREISPVFHADKIRKPLIVLQGANDPRVVKAESDDIVAAVKKNGVPVEYVVFPDEGHGFSKRANEIAGYGAILRFLDEHLKGKAKAPGPSAAGQQP